MTRAGRAESPSRADILRIDAARDVRLARALHDRTAVREERELVLAAVIRELGPQHEAIRHDVAVRAQARRDLVEVKPAGVLPVCELHRVPSAERRRSRAEPP